MAHPAHLAAPAPPAPAALVASPGNARVHLSWDPVDGASSYRVLRNGRPIATPVEPEFLDTWLLNGTAYTYSVIAVVDGVESGRSTAALATPAPNIPAAPGRFLAQAADGASILRWDAVRGATSYRVYRGGLLVAHTLGTSYRDTDLENGTTYRYHLKALRAGVESAESPPVSVTPCAPPPHAAASSPGG